MYKVHLEDYDVTLSHEFGSFVEAFKHGVSIDLRFSIWERDRDSDVYMYMGACDGASMKWHDASKEQRSSYC